MFPFSNVFSNRLILSPMAGYTDSPFRRIVKVYDCKLVYTELISAVAILRGVGKELYRFFSDEKPIIAQIFGQSPEIMRDASLILIDMGFDGIDINLGCPAKKVIKTGSGFALSQNLSQLKKVIYAIRKAIKKPLSCKIRIGKSHKDKNYVELVKLLEGEGVDFIAVHGRTFTQGFSGDISIEDIKNIVKLTSLPVIGSGGVKEYSDAIRLINHTGAIAWMVGRASIGNPWIFSNVKKDSISSYLFKKCIKSHLLWNIDFYGERKGILNFRKHFLKYISGVKDAKKIKEKAIKIEKVNDFISIIEAL